jgi:metal-responsive CopG/Arc/MetJ family transcriptional regulator
MFRGDKGYCTRSEIIKKAILMFKSERLFLSAEEGTRTPTP